MPVHNNLIVGVLLWTFLVSSARGQISYGFGQIDYTGAEPNGVVVEVVKRMPNVADFYINVTPLTYAELTSMGLPLPPEIDENNLPDAAEFDPSGTQDFLNDRFTVVFPPSTSVGEVEMLVTITFIDDDTNEAQEGFYLLASIDSTQSNPTDVQQAMAIRNGIALINIDDDDQIRISFEMPDYEFAESAGLVNIFVIKEDGRASEQELRVLVQISVGGNNAAERGSDFEVPGLNPDLELVFGVTDSRLSISIEILEDNVLELNETFPLLLSIPQNPPDGQLSGLTPQTTIHIYDNEVGRIGFEQEKYNVSEGAGSVDVCAAILEPELSLIARNVQAFLFAETVNGTAIAVEDYTPLVAGSFAGDTIDLLDPLFRQCVTVMITDDTIVEETEDFGLTLVTDDEVNGFLGASFTFGPIAANVCIIDDDVAPSTPVPTTTSVGPITTSMPSLPPPVATTLAPSMTATPTPTSSPGGGGDPHYSVLLPTGQLLCYSVHGEHDFAFNLISSDIMQMNALFIADSRREEITWIGELGITVKQGPRKRANTTKVRFCATENTVCIGDKVKLNAHKVEKIIFANGKISISEGIRDEGNDRPEVVVEFPDLGLSFTVWFVRGKHLDMSWNRVEGKLKHPHGMIGQFFNPGVEVDETRRLLILPGMEPVPVMRKPVWHFMERDNPEDQLCWVAMNPGYQGKKLLQGHYLDYLVDDVLSSKFAFKPSKRA